MTTPPDRRRPGSAESGLVLSRGVRLDTATIPYTIVIMKGCPFKQGVMLLAAAAFVNLSSTWTCGHSIFMAAVAQQHEVSHHPHHHGPCQHSHPIPDDHSEHTDHVPLKSGFTLLANSPSSVKKLPTAGARQLTAHSIASMPAGAALITGNRALRRTSCDCRFGAPAGKLFLHTERWLC